jgi:hypothetical protein
MDIVTRFINDNRTEQNMDLLKSEIDAQISHLQRLARYADVGVIQTIRQITDIDTLEALRVQCIETKRELENERAYGMQMQNVEVIIHAYKKCNTNARCIEVNLLHTIHSICYYHSSGNAYEVEFVINNVKHLTRFSHKKLIYVKIDGFGDSLLYLPFSSWDDVLLNKLAFMAKLTANEYKTFLYNMQNIMNKADQMGRIAFNHKPKVFAVSIANLLLCAMHEQYPPNINIAEMSMADFVFHDEYLLKCITSIECLDEKN